ncbi:MAG TPA: hypothetical protein VIL37_18990 [Natronosporangium sp.]
MRRSRSEVVPESAYDYAEIIRRGGANRTDEDFMLLKCLSCSVLYLYDAEVDTVYTDPDDLSQRQPAGANASELLQCLACGRPIPGHSCDSHYRSLAELLGRARKRCPIFDVTWDEVARSRWSWTIQPTAWPARYR